MQKIYRCIILMKKVICHWSLVLCDEYLGPEIELLADACIGFEIVTDEDSGVEVLTDDDLRFEMVTDEDSGIELLVEADKGPGTQLVVEESPGIEMLVDILLIKKNTKWRRKLKTSTGVYYLITSISFPVIE